MDERRWIVLPFNNITRSSDIEWLRDASVNLLTLDLSAWREVTVVDDKRVADFMREIPPARARRAHSAIGGK